MLTRLEEKILQYLTQYLSQNGHGPTLMEIGEALEIHSKGTVHRYVASLVEKGHLHRSGRGWRSIRLAGEHERRLTILPLLGRIAAGKPIEAIEDSKEVNFSDLLLGPNRYVLQVKGDSMLDAGILDGDMVVIEHSNTANNGDIVVALIDEEEATLKYLQQAGDEIELIPANDEYESMRYPSARVTVQGVLVGQVRLY